MGTIISITLTQGTNLLRLLHQPIFRIGKEVGDKKFTENIASNCNKRMHLFYKVLRKESPLLQDLDKVYFGPKEDYDCWMRKPIESELKAGENPEKDVVVYEVKESLIKKTIDLELTGKEVDGLFWTMFLLSHPASPTCQSPAVMDMLVWPLTIQIDLVKKLEEEIGLSKGEVQELTRDSDRAKEEEKAKAEKEETERKKADKKA